VNATALAPVAARALGRGVTGGLVDLALEHARTEPAGAGDGRIAITATALELEGTPPDAWPLRLALSTDAGGRTEIGATSDAAAARMGAGVAHAAVRAVQEQLAAVAAEPFEALARVAGRDPAALRAVEFEPGTAELSAAGSDTLSALAAALAERPLLGLGVGGGFDAQADRDALARQQIELHVTPATAGAAPQARPRPIEFASARAQDILDEFARERL